MSEALTDPQAVSALRSVAHPVRIRILSLLTAQAMSAAEVARELRLTHANASYHLRVLQEAGELVVESEEKIRGGVAKRYRYVVVDAPAVGAPATNEDRIAYVHAIATDVTRRQSRHQRGSGQLSDIETWVEPEVWDEAVSLLRQASDLLHSRAAAPRSAGTKHVSASMFAFEMEDGMEDGS
ncbi:Helix-turn-helix domain-containing protein [Nocardioides exalbidus]|uniref:Helix-turn-helix domain-containing protein n=1 Tax=Nocardioides exalbidus TaxID=402596 RepID=A0A1H4VN44_9ACTN|nr:helix-turn-helix domain-containing protein [Nocardioides exalbidus]SEC81988.1 Helix-turn-helix domain-containing protein [Nocardioides exalbidus]